MEKLKAIIQIIRPELPLAGGICVIAGQIIVLENLPSGYVGLLGFLTGFFISSAAMVTNDYFDLDVDRVNHPQRPLPSGKISPSEIKVLTAILSISGFLTAALLGPLPLALSIFLWMVAIMYNWKGKETGLLGNVMVAISVTGFFIFGGLSVGGLKSGLIWIFGALAFLFDLAEEIAGDAMDMEGDKERSSKTIARTHGKKYALTVSSTLYSFLVILSLVPLIMGWLDLNFLCIFIPLDMAIIYLSLKILKTTTVEEGRKRIRQLFLTMTAFVIIFVALLLL